MDTPTRTAGNDTAIRVRALEHEVEALAALPVNELPHTARTILHGIGNLLIALRWLLEDAHQKTAGV